MKDTQMQVKSLHINHIMPTLGTNGAGAYDIYMPEDGSIPYKGIITVGLGFAAAVPAGYVALLLPRSSVGAKFGLELNNTCGVIDSDYRGEWKAVFHCKNDNVLSWKQGERLLQFLIVPVVQVVLQSVDTLPDTDRGNGGFGSSGK